jgi:hypothetical protein
MVSDVFGPHTAVRTRTLLTCGAIAGPMFTVAWLVEGATRADYSPLRHPVSSLALGEFGWTGRERESGHSRVDGPSTLSPSREATGFLLASVGFSQAPGWVEVAGLVQRITITIGWTWLTLLAVHLHDTPAAASAV